MKITFVRNNEQLVLDMKQYEVFEFSESGTGIRKHIFIKLRNYTNELELLKVKEFIYDREDDNAIRIDINENTGKLQLKCDSAAIKTMTSEATNNETRFSLELTFSLKNMVVVNE